MGGWELMLERVAQERYPRLVAHGMLLTGSQAEAEDLVQDALGSTFAGRTRFVTVEQAEAYVRRAVVSRFIDQGRRRTAERRALVRVAGQPVGVVAAPSSGLAPEVERGTGAGTIQRQVGPGEPFPFALTGTYAADGVVAREGDDRTDLMPECATGVDIQNGQQIERLSASSDARAWVNSWAAHGVVGVVYVEAQGSCASDPHPRILTAYDVATGATTELMPAPPGDNPNDVWRQGLSSYVVVGDPSSPEIYQWGRDELR